MHIHIVGLGGVGFWLTTGLANLVDLDNVSCWDYDTLEGGHGATRLPPALPATKKVDLLRGFLLVSLAMPKVPKFIDRKFSGISGITKGDVVVDCTDMGIRARKAMWTRCTRRGAKMLRVSYDGRMGMIVASTGLPLIGTDAGGYAEMPTLALSMAAGGIGAELVKRYIDKPVDHFQLAVSIGGALE